MTGTVPVGYPEQLAMMLGGMMFFAALVAARWRARGAPRDTGGAQDRRSILWIALQSIGIGCVGIGPVVRASDPLALRHWAAGAVVLALFGATAALFHWASVTMGRNWALVARMRADGALVTTGPFAYVRNPIYVALALFLFGLAGGVGHWRAVLLGFPIYALATWFRVRSEEAVLRATFDDVFVRYARQVPRFVPRLRPTTPAP